MSRSKKSYKSKKSTTSQQSRKSSMSMNSRASSRKSFTKQPRKSLFDRIRNGVSDLSKSVGRFTKFGRRAPSASSIIRGQALKRAYSAPARKANKSATRITTAVRSPTIKARSVQRIQRPKITAHKTPSEPLKPRKKVSSPTRNVHRVTTRSVTRNALKKTKVTAVKPVERRISVRKVNTRPSCKSKSKIAVTKRSTSRSVTKKAAKKSTFRKSRSSQKMKPSKKKSPRNTSVNDIDSEVNVMNSESHSNSAVMLPVNLIRRMYSASMTSIKDSLMPIVAAKEDVEEGDKLSLKSNDRKTNAARTPRKRKPLRTLKEPKRGRYSLQASPSELEVREKRVDQLIKEFDQATTTFLYRGLLAPEVPKPAFLYYVNEQREINRAKSLTYNERKPACESDVNSQDEAVLIASEWSRMDKNDRTPYLQRERDDRSRFQLQSLTYQTELNKVKQIDNMRN